MPTLSFDGSVYFSTEVDRRELVRIAPSLSVTVLMNRARSTVLSGETHEVHFDDLPNNVATAVLFSVSSGDVLLTIRDNNANPAEFQITPTGMFILLNTFITDLTVLGNEDSVYDLIAGG